MSERWSREKYKKQDQKFGKSLISVDAEFLLEKSIAFVDPFLTEEFGK